MKKPIVTKQGCLKALLLLMLAGNIAWQPALRDLMFASFSSEVVGGNPAPQSADFGTMPTTTRAPNPEAVTTQLQGEQDRTTARHVDTPKVCGERFIITYKEVATDNGRVTEVSAEMQGSPEDTPPMVTFRWRGGFDVNVKRKEVKKENDAKIAKAIQRKMGSSCSSEIESEDPQVSVDRPTDRPSQDRPGREDLTAEEREALRHGINECRLDRRGERLNETEQTRCRLKQLDKLELRDDDRRSHSAVMTKLEKIIRGDIRRSIKNKLMSNDEDKVSDGEELLEEAVEQVRSLTDELELDPRRASKLIGELEALKVGGETFRKSSALDEEVKAAKADMRDQMNQALLALRANPNDPWARQAVIELQRQQMQQQQMFQNQMQYDIIQGPYAQMQGLNQVGLLSAMDMNGFSSPLIQLRQDLMSMIEVNRGGLNVGPYNQNSVSVPTDFMTYRNGLNNGRAPMGNFGTSAVDNAPVSGVFNSLNGPPTAAAAPVGGRRWQ